MSERQPLLQATRSVDDRLQNKHDVSINADSTAEKHGDIVSDSGLGAQPQKKQASFWVVALCLVVVQTGFGAYGIVVREWGQSSHANAIVFSFYRDFCAGPVLLATARYFEGPIQLPYGSKELMLFVGLGLTGMFGGQLFYIMGVYFAGPDIASIYQPAMPVWAAVFVVIVGVERVPNICQLNGVLKIGGVLLAATGAVITGVFKSGGSKKHQQDEALGAIFSLVNTFLFAIYMTIQKKMIFHPGASLEIRWGQRPTYVTAWSYMFGALFMLIGALVSYFTHFSLLGFNPDSGHCPMSPTNETSEEPFFPGMGCPNQNITSALSKCSDSGPVCLSQWKYMCHNGQCRLKTNTLNLPTEAIPSIVYAVLITSSLNYGLITFANKNCSTSVVSAFWPLQVFVAVALSYIAFGETINYMQGIGGLLIILGLAAVVASNREKRSL